MPQASPRSERYFSPSSRLRGKAGAVHFCSLFALAIVTSAAFLVMDASRIGLMPN